MISFWEQQSFLSYDLIVIGSGIVGLSTAINLKERYPEKSILVLDRGILPIGASTRNAGFACFGGLSELADDAQTQSDDALWHLYKQRKDGIGLLRKRLGDAAIGYTENGSHEFLYEHEASLLESMPRFNELLSDLHGKTIFQLADEKISEFGVSALHYKHCISVSGEGAVHTGKMMRALWGLAQDLGVMILTGVEVSHWEETSQKVVIYTEDSYRKVTLSFSASKLLVTTNAFTKRFFPSLDMQPGRGQVIVTKPVSGLKLQGIYHVDRGYYYFRQIEDRVLLGGGRNLDFVGETTTEIGVNEQIVADLVTKLREEILPTTKFEIEFQWSGIMAFGSSKQPLIMQHSPRVLGAFRMGGMGVALASQTAMDLAQKVNFDE